MSCPTVAVSLLAQNAGRIPAGWQYFSSPNGVLRSFPGRAWEPAACAATNFEPRSLSWYSAASTGPKSIVVVFDVSFSMREDDRLSLSTQAIAGVLATLTPSDWFGVVAFNSTAALFSPQLQPATPDAIASANVWISCGLSWGSDGRRALDWPRCSCVSCCRLGWRRLVLGAIPISLWDCTRDCSC